MKFNRKPLAPALKRKHKLKSKYGVTPEFVESLLKDQNYKCAICESIEQLCIDHDHKTNKVRGMLCHRCNQGIGLLRDNLNIIKNAFEYLDKANEQVKAS